jgi:hypothetical protein
MPKAPRKKKTTTVVEEIPAGESSHIEDEENGPTELDFSLEEVRSAEQFQAIIEQFPDAGITAKLYDSEGKYCYRVPDPASIDEDVIRKRCGAGDFNLRIYVNGKYRQAIPLPIRQLLSSESDNNANSLPGVVSFDTRHSEFLERQAQRNHELLLAAIGSKNSSGTSVTDLVAALSQLDGLRGKPENATDILMKGIQLAQSLEGKTDWKTDVLRTVQDIAPKALDLLSGKQVPGPVPGGQPTMPINPQQQSALPPDAIIKAGLGFLKKKAIGGVDPELIVDWIEANAEDEQYQILLHAVFTLSFEDVVKYDPEIGTGPFLPFFRQLYDGLRSRFSPANSMDVDSRGIMGDSDNAGNNGQSSTVGSKK